MDVDGFAGGEVGVDGVEDGGGERGGVGDGAVADGEGVVGGAFEQVGVGEQAVGGVGEVDEGGDARAAESGEFGAGGGLVEGAGVFAGQELAGEDPVAVGDGRLYGRYLGLG